MRVLHLPVNNGSRASHTVRVLRQIGVDAFGLIRTRTFGQSPDELKIIDLGSKLGSRYSKRLLLFVWPWIYNFLKYVRWADILHWYSGAMALPLGLDLAIVKHLGKPSIVEWQGAEIRIPEVEFADNPYYAVAVADGREYNRYENLQQSRRLQKRFRDAGFVCSAAPGMVQHIQKDIFPNYYILPRRLILSDYQPVFPQTDVKKPIVVHAPTAPISKGTPVVLRTIEQLKPHCNFEFRLIQGIPRSQVLQILKKADILLDQFVVGDFGSVSLEAMALGKPVVCYIKPTLAAQYPSDLPIVNATQETLPNVLEELINEPELRRNLGQRGRAYVEKNHNALEVAKKLKGIYEELLQRHQEA